MAAEYTPQEVAEHQAAHSIQLIDVREGYEWEAGRIEGARHIALTELGAQASTIGRDRPVVFYCRSGARSAMATEALLQAGYEAHNMTGGMLQWQAAGLEMEPADGVVAG